MGFNKNLLLTIMSLSLALSTHAAIPSFPFISPSLAPTSSPIINTDPSIVNKAVEATEQIVKPNHEIIKFCSVTENPALCAESITPYFKGSSFDHIKALETEVNATLNQTKKVVGIIAESLADPNTDPKVHGALTVCNSQYKSIVSTIKEASVLLMQQNVVDAYYKFSSVTSDQSACEDAFLESGVKITFPNDSFAVFQLGGNCLAIMDGIVNTNRNNFYV